MRVPLRSSYIAGGLVAFLLLAALGPAGAAPVPRPAPQAVATGVAPAPDPALLASPCPDVGCRAAPTPAAGGEVWFNITLTQRFEPPHLTGSGVIFDAIDGVIVLFGGCSAAQCPAPAQTWEFTGGAWTNVTNQGPQPPPRYDANFVYDSRDGYGLLFGGFGVNGVPLNDTWSYVGDTWTNLTNATQAPPARGAAAATFDHADSEVVLFGGCGAGPCPRNDTWRFQSGQWKNITLTVGAPPASRDRAAFVWENGDNMALLFGGCGAVCPLGDTWAFSKGKWAPLAPALSPPARQGAAMSYTGVDNATYLFGGAGATGDRADTWRWANGKWANVTLTTVTTAAPRDGMVAIDSTVAWTLTGARKIPFTMFFGGNVSACLACAPGPSNESWVLEPPLFVAPSALPSVVEVGQPVAFSSAAVGGSGGPYVYLWSFGDRMTAFAQSPTHSYGGPGVYLVGVTASDVAGVWTRGTVDVTVLPGPAVFALAIPLATDIQRPITFSGAASGGTAPYAYRWTFGDQSGASTSSATHAYATPGNFSANLTVTDQVQGYGVGWANVTVHPLPQVQATASASATTLGTNVSFAATVVGGTAPYTYAWTFSDGGAAAVASVVHAFNRTGTFRASIVIADAVGAESSQNFSVVVTNASVHLPTSPTVPWYDSKALWGWTAVGGAIVLIAAATVLLLRHRRRPPTPLAAAPVGQSDWGDDESATAANSRSMRRNVDRFYRRSR
jgi:hypothetical protein